MDVKCHVAGSTDSSLMTDGRIQLARFHIRLRKVLLGGKKREKNIN